MGSKALSIDSRPLRTNYVYGAWNHAGFAKQGPDSCLSCLSSGFIKIDTNSLGDSTDSYLEVLDGTRVHPETYEWARKMAVDALEYDDTSEDANPAAAVEEILESPERLKDLDLDAFAVELERQVRGTGIRISVELTRHEVGHSCIHSFVRSHSLLIVALHCSLHSLQVPLRLFAY